MPKTIERGRCLAIRPIEGGQKLLLRSESGSREIHAQGDAAVQIGDWVEVRGGIAWVLTPNRTPEHRITWTERILHPRRLRAMEIRSRVEAAIRAFFVDHDFREVRTPLLVPCPGMEPHIRPIRVEGGAYLPTSPEFAMKRLLAGGLERIFQLCPAFRLEPNSNTHHPEFTMLEWYRAFAGYEDIQRDTEELFASVARKLNGRPSLRFQGRDISVETPWPRLRVRDLFRAEAGVDLVASPDVESMRDHCARLGLGSDPADTWDDLYFRIWLNVIEPRLPADRAVFVTRYPASQAALSVKDRDPDGSEWARRFEAYAGGLELGNAFEELTDPVEQRARFEVDMRLRERIYGPSFPASPLDEGFLDALTEGMPPAGGIALGVDRMVMLFADEPEIDWTLWLPSESPRLP